MTIGDKIRLLKRQSRFTLQHIADMLDTTTAEIAGLMSGRRRPGLWKVVDLARCFSVTVEQLLYGVERWTVKRGDPLSDYKPRWTQADHDG
jgi:transcriptional regulator with XRE-family HTH domain